MPPGINTLHEMEDLCTFWDNGTFTCKCEREKEKKNASRHAYDREIGLRRFEGRANDNGVSAAKCQEFCDSDGGQHMFECQKERERRRFQEAAKKIQTFDYDRECEVMEQRKAKTYSG